MKNKGSIKLLSFAILIAFTVMVINGCNDEEGTPENISTKQIGNEGGALSTADGAISLTIPQGAMADGTQVSIEATEATAPNGIGKVYSLSPEGTQFTKPVALSFQYTDEDVKNIPLSRMAIAFKKEDNKWQIMPTLKIDEVTKTITTETTHFSQWSLIDGLPAITSFSPTTANNDVNTTISITGKNFSSVPAENVVTVNNVAVVVASVSSDQLVIMLPAGGSTGKIKIVVNGNAVSSVDDFTVVNTTPTITGFTPTSAFEGITTTVSITGTHFSTVAAENVVSVNGIPATVASASANQLMVILPGTITTGLIKVVVNGKITQSADNFTVVSTTPTVTGFDPTSMQQGIITTVAISGTNFSSTPSENIVSINGLPVNVVTSTATQLMVIIPPDATTGSFKVIVKDKIVESAGTFTVVPATPTITGFSPVSALQGIITNVTINGTNFSTTLLDNVVSLNGVPVPVMVVTVAPAASTMIVVVPANATSGKFQITVKGKAALSASDFTVISTLPSITSFSPTSGTKGIDTTITISGSNFSSVPSENHVSINGIPVTVMACTTTTLAVIIPGIATSGQIQVTVGDQIVQSANSFIFN